MLEVNFSPFPVLTTERLHLVKVTKEHLHDMMFLRGNKEVMRYIDRPLIETIEAAEELMQKINTLYETNSGVNWAITLPGETKMIGNIGFHRIDKENHRAEIGYLLHPDYHRKGIMHEAITAVLTYAFHEMKLHSVEAHINPLNDASRKLLEKNGFVKEAHFRENHYWNGTFIDSAIYSLLTPLRLQ